MKTYPNFPIGTEVQLRTRGIADCWGPWHPEKYVIENSRKRDGLVIYYIQEVGQPDSCLRIVQEDCIRTYPQAHCNRKHELHNHPIWERNLALGDKHVIIDRAEFDKLNQTRYNGNEAVLLRADKALFEVDRSRYIHRGIHGFEAEPGMQDFKLTIENSGSINADALRLMGEGPVDIIIRRACK
jgi:hypothetical protein